MSMLITKHDSPQLVENLNQKGNNYCNFDKI